MSLVLDIDAFDLGGFSHTVSEFGQSRFGYVVTANVDHLIRYHDDARFRSLYAEASFVLLDSRFLGHLLGITRGVRVPVCPGSDLTERILGTIAAPADRIVLVGGTDEQVRSLRDRYGFERLHHVNPKMGFVNDPAALEDCLARIEEASPFRFCLLAVGSPQQELVAHSLKTRDKARGLALCIGASVNFMTGAERRAPRWLQSLGCEWAWRLARNPERLGRRYLVRGPRIFALLPRFDLRLRTSAPRGDAPAVAEVAPAATAE